WRSNPSKSETIKGRYIDGRKHGVWMQRKGERKVKIKYQMGDTLGIYNPTFRQVMNNFKWLSNKEFHICSKYLFQFEVLSTNMLQTYPCMSNEFHEICEDNLTFKFISNSMVNIKHSIVETKNAEDLSGIYKYSIDQELNLIIDLNENGIISRKIKYFGKDAIK
ncbi:MAG: hypothetical protein P1U56_26400, partial [Saprospiraceae bacterium]|nr:hypothetical protein [Saprospiraceae bacterium]